MELKPKVKWFEALLGDSDVVSSVRRSEGETAIGIGFYVAEGTVAVTEADGCAGNRGAGWIKNLAANLGNLKRRRLNTIYLSNSW